MILRSLAGVLCVLGVVCLSAPEPAQAQQVQRPFGKVLEEWNRALDQAAQELAEPDLAAPRGEALKEHLAAIESEARAIKARAESEIAPLQSRLEALGPAPGEGEPPEAEEIAAQRREIGEDIAFYETRIKHADLAVARVEELREQVAARTLERSLEVLFKRYPLPLAPATLARAVPDFFRALGLIARSPSDWWASLSEAQRERIIVYRVALVVLFAFVLGWGLRRTLLRRFGRDPALEAPSYTRRLSGAVADGLARGLVPSLILAAFLAWALSDESLISGLFAQAFVTLCAVTIMFVLAWALPRAVLAPDLPAWRLIPVTPEHARPITRRIAFLAGVFAVDLFFVNSSRDLVVSDELVSLYTLIAKSLEAGGILALMQGGLWAADGAAAAAQSGTAGRGQWTFWSALRRVISIVAVALVVAALAGYANLSRYLAESLVLSGMVVGVLVLLRGLLRELIGAALRSKLLQDTLAMPHGTRSRYKFWLRALLDLVAYAGGLALTLVAWGVAPGDLLRFVGRLMQDFTVGNVTISLSDILVAVLVFFVVMTATRMTQRLLSERVFPRTQLDVGIRHSLSAGLGYAGLALAAALAVAALGLDLSNLALIAGALSVGIGFGLQNVVNNFVSGLILLIERPIKVGDWILVGGHEGYVKRINVRATEIETFQRAAVIVPNSELIAGTVTNWTHKDRYGRVEVPVGVAYGSDVARVMDILQRCLREHEMILSHPEPYALFRGFGDSSLDFEARGFIANVLYRLSVQSDLRVAIYQAFAEAGIQIPFPQRDLHIKSVERLPEGLKVTVGEPGRGAAPPGVETSAPAVAAGPDEGQE